MSTAGVLIRFGPSPIHGQGGFACADIARGAAIIEYCGERISKSESVARCQRGNPFIFSVDEQFDVDGSAAGNAARLLNHSCDSNCEARAVDGRIWVVAVRDILAGEEITFNYSYDLEDYRDHPCSCGAPNCVGYMVAEELFPIVRGKVQVAPAC